MKRSLVFIGSAVAALALAKGAVDSGLRKGESVTPFHPNHFAGPLADTTNCFPCTFQNRPQVQVWLNGATPATVEAFASKLDAEMGQRAKQEFKALIVLVAPKGAAASLKAEGLSILKAHGLSRVAMATIAPDNEAVKAYKIRLSPEVRNTVLVYRNWTVRDKMVNLTTDAKGFAALDAAIAGAVK